VFLSQVLSNFGTVGAIAPSSPLLAKAIVHPLQDRPERPISVLEAGAGTGVFTAQILKSLRRGDRLDVYELNPRLFGCLNRILQRQEPQTRGVRCNLHNADVRLLSQPRPYDFIVCGLPFNSFDVQTVDEILEILMDHLTDSGVFAYFEYSLTPQVRGRFLKAADRDRLRKVHLRIRSFTQKHQFSSRQVWWNLPPAKARFCRKEPPDNGLQASSRAEAAGPQSFPPLAEHR
jgi:phospholipid N-methyltransferase